jgi:hypothetical protein
MESSLSLRSRCNGYDVTVLSQYYRWLPTTVGGARFRGKWQRFRTLAGVAGLQVSLQVSIAGVAGLQACRMQAIGAVLTF